MIVRPIPFGDPARLFRRFAGEPFAMLLDGASDAGGRGRFSYIAATPFRTIVADGTGVRVDGRPVAGDPFAVLEAELARNARPWRPAPAPFTGGAVGYLGYGLARCLERLPSRHAAPHGVPDMAVGLYDTVAAFDTLEGRAWVIARDPAGADRLAGRLADRLAAPAPPPPDAGPLPPAVWRADLTRAEYEARVSRVLDYIRAGDIFQANFTQAFRAGMPAGTDAYALYERLRRMSPAPFAAFLDCGDVRLLSVSPERFLKLSPDGTVETRPIKGTRPRHADPDIDAAAARELASSVKDNAENLMIVDLLRNDLGRAARIGSVAVHELCRVESFASVHHLVSAVTARLRPGLGPVDLLRAAFPGGSVTGAPKIRAMEIIDELEVAQRGPYCGSICWIGFDGAMDGNIVIRTIVLAGDTAIAQAGGGIVADSDPAAEYEEMMVKIRPLLGALAGTPQPAREDA